MRRNSILLFHILFFIFLSIFSKVFSQNLSVLYELTYKPNSNTEETRKQNYILDVFSQKSIFRTDMRKKSDSMISKNGLGFGYNLDVNYELYLTKDHNELTYKKYFVSPMSRDRFFINIKDKLNWNILSETIVIESLKCQKAEVEYAGRHWTAWFSQEISTSEGPYYFYGLPGLIIQIQDDHQDFLFKLQQIKKGTIHSLYEVKGGNEISWEQYKKLLQDYFDDPFLSVKNKGMKVITDDGNGGYKPLDTRGSIKGLQKLLQKNNNPIELNQRFDYK